MVKKKPLKTELHHWWPRTLADHWAANDGMVSVVRPSGQIRRAPPGRFGAITNAHHMKLGSPWDSTFEPLFNQPDSEIGEFVQWLATLETTTCLNTKPRIERITPQQLSHTRSLQIARVVASLLARSPSIRHSIRLGIQSFCEPSGLTEPTINKPLIAINQRGLYDAYRKCMERAGRWAILFSDEREFVSGDGFLHNFPASQMGVNTGRKLVLPILPTATIVYTLPLAYPSEPRLITMKISAAEVEELNRIVQAYAQDFIFFRDQQPIATDAFKIGRHQIFQYHDHAWLDELLDDLSQYNRWGPNGGPGMLSRRPYSESAQANRWLETFLDND